MIFQFITEEELEALPHDQPTVAFARLEKIAQSSKLDAEWIKQLLDIAEKATERR